MLVEGKIIEIFDEQQITDRFKKREFVLLVDYDTEWPQSILMQTVNKNISQLEKVQVGDYVNVDFSIKGREWVNEFDQKKYFNSIDVWKIQKV